MNEKQENNILSQDVQQLETTLRGLWDQTKHAAEMIQTLRVQNRALQKNVDELELKMSELQRMLHEREEQVQVTQQQLRDIRSNGLGMLDKNDKAELRKQIISLIDKINSHL